MRDLDSGTNGAGLVAPMRYRGITYDIGVEYSLGESSRALWTRELMRREIDTIQRELHGNAIGIYGSDIERVVAAGEYAAGIGLQVWLQPRPMDVSPDEALDQLVQLARSSERLRQRHGHINLTVGCEVSLFLSGFVPGSTYTERIEHLMRSSREPTISAESINAFLSSAVACVRRDFAGSVTYGAGPWEWPVVDWSVFDFVGIDHYLGSGGAAAYAQAVRDLARNGKPILVLEFGCCTYEGAQALGGIAWDVVDYDAKPPRVRDGLIRSERAQADAIGTALDILDAEGVTGAFVFTFIEPTQPHSVDRRFDLDMASYGVVKVHASRAATTPGSWAPKRAFYEIARRFAR